jgi:hypothetical protein
LFLKQHGREPQSEVASCHLFTVYSDVVMLTEVKEFKTQTLYSEGLWRWCDVFRRILLLDFIYRPMFFSLKTTFHNWYSSPDTNTQVKSRRIRWEGYVARMGVERNLYTLCNKNQAVQIFLVPNRRWCKRTAGDIIRVVRNPLLFVRVWLFSKFNLLQLRVPDIYMQRKISLPNLENRLIYRY